MSMGGQSGAEQTSESGQRSMCGRFRFSAAVPLSLVTESLYDTVLPCPVYSPFFFSLISDPLACCRPIHRWLPQSSSGAVVITACTCMNTTAKYTKEQWNESGGYLGNISPPYPHHYGLISSQRNIHLYRVSVSRRTWGPFFFLPSNSGERWLKSSRTISHRSAKLHNHFCGLML